MDFDFTEDQGLLIQTLERWAADHMEIDANDRAATYLPGETLAAELAEQGYFDVSAELGLLGAVLLVDKVCRTPWAIEVAASALVAPMLNLRDLPRPLAMLSVNGRPVARFLSTQGAALVDAGDHVRLLRNNAGIQPLKNPYAYPFGLFDGDLLAASERLDDVPVAAYRRLRQLAVTAEAVSAVQAALDLTVEYVKTRVQFGRAIGSFQAVQHRLAECSVMAHSAQLLLYKAAVDNLGGTQMAAIVTHDAIKRVLYETNQFHGAIGLTLEYPLHLWTYRLRVLQFELASGMTGGEGVG